jgi:hypothetical protein
MMQMLAAGGCSILTDNLRTADPNNPRGYYELQKVKTLAKNPEVLAAAEGKVVKVVSSLLSQLPGGNEYRIVFMCRPLEEVISSQDRMLTRLGQQVPPTPRAAVIRAFDQHLTQVRGWLSQQPSMSVLYVDYPALLQDARREAVRVRAFLEQELDVEAMVRQVDQSLYRERIAPAPPLV